MDINRLDDTSNGIKNQSVDGLSIDDNMLYPNEEVKSGKSSSSNLLEGTRISVDQALEMARNKELNKKDLIDNSITVDQSDPFYFQKMQEAIQTNLQNKIDNGTIKRSDFFGASDDLGLSGTEHYNFSDNPRFVKLAKQGKLSGGLYQDAAEREMWRDQNEQGGSSLYWKSLKGLGVQAAAGFLKQLGGWYHMFTDIFGTNENLDFSGKLKGTNDTFLDHWSNTFVNYAEENLAIYRSPDKPASNWDREGLAQLNQTLGFTLGVMVETILENAILMGAAGKMRAVLTAGKTAATSLRAGRIANTTVSLLQGATAGARDAMQNSELSAKELYQKLIAGGMSHEEANRLAAQSFNNSLDRALWVNVMLTGLTNLMIFGPSFASSTAINRGATSASVRRAFAQQGQAQAPTITGISGSIETGLGMFVDRVMPAGGRIYLRHGKSISNAIPRGLLKHVPVPVIQGFEGMMQMQYGVSANNDILELYNLDYHMTKGERWWNESTQLGLSQGIFSGILMGSTGQLKKAIFGRKARAQMKVQQAAIDQAITSSMADYNTKLKAISEKYSKNEMAGIEVREVDAETSMLTMLMASDHLQGNTGSYNSYLTRLKRAVVAAEHGNKKDLARLGFDTSDTTVELLKNRGKDMIRRAVDFREKYAVEYNKIVKQTGEANQDIALMRAKIGVRHDAIDAAMHSAEVRIAELNRKLEESYKNDATAKANEGKEGTPLEIKSDDLFMKEHARELNLQAQLTLIEQQNADGKFTDAKEYEGARQKVIAQIVEAQNNKQDIITAANKALSDLKQLKEDGLSNEMADYNERVKLAEARIESYNKIISSYDEGHQITNEQFEMMAEFDQLTRDNIERKGIKKQGEAALKQFENPDNFKYLTVYSLKQQLFEAKTKDEAELIVGALMSEKEITESDKLLMNRFARKYNFTLDNAKRRYSSEQKNAKSKIEEALKTKEGEKRNVEKPEEETMEREPDLLDTEEENSNSMYERNADEMTDAPNVDNANKEQAAKEHETATENAAFAMNEMTNEANEMAKTPLDDGVYVSQEAEQRVNGVLFKSYTFSDAMENSSHLTKLTNDINDSLIAYSNAKSKGDSAEVSAHLEKIIKDSNELYKSVLEKYTQENFEKLSVDDIDNLYNLRERLDSQLDQLRPEIESYLHEKKSKEKIKSTAEDTSPLSSVFEKTKSLEFEGEVTNADNIKKMYSDVREAYMELQKAQTERREVLQKLENKEEIGNEAYVNSFQKLREATAKLVMLIETYRSDYWSYMARLGGEQSRNAQQAELMTTVMQMLEHRFFPDIHNEMANQPMLTNTKVNDTSDAFEVVEVVDASSMVPGVAVVKKVVTPLIVDADGNVIQRGKIEIYKNPGEGKPENVQNTRTTEDGGVIIMDEELPLDFNEDGYYERPIYSDGMNSGKQDEHIADVVADYNGGTKRGTPDGRHYRKIMEERDGKPSSQEIIAQNAVNFMGGMLANNTMLGNELTVETVTAMIETVIDHIGAKTVQQRSASFDALEVFLNEKAINVGVNWDAIRSSMEQNIPEGEVAGVREAKQERSASENEKRRIQFESKAVSDVAQKNQLSTVKLGVDQIPRTMHRGANGKRSVTKPTESGIATEGINKDYGIDHSIVNDSELLKPGTAVTMKVMPNADNIRIAMYSLDGKKFVGWRKWSTINEENGWLRSNEKTLKNGQKTFRQEFIELFMERNDGMMPSEEQINKFREFWITQNIPMGIFLEESCVGVLRETFWINLRNYGSELSTDEANYALINKARKKNKTMREAVMKSGEAKAVIISNERSEVHTSQLDHEVKLSEVFPSRGEEGKQERGTLCVSIGGTKLAIESRVNDTQCTGDANITALSQDGSITGMVYEIRNNRMYQVSPMKLQTDQIETIRFLLYAFAANQRNGDGTFTFPFKDGKTAFTKEMLDAAVSKFMEAYQIDDGHGNNATRVDESTIAELLSHFIYVEGRERGKYTKRGETAIEDWFKANGNKKGALTAMLTDNGTMLHVAYVDENGAQLHYAIGTNSLKETIGSIDRQRINQSKLENIVAEYRHELETKQSEEIKSGKRERIDSQEIEHLVEQRTNELMNDTLSDEEIADIAADLLEKKIHSICTILTQAQTNTSAKKLTMPDRFATVSFSKDEGFSVKQRNYGDFQAEHYTTRTPVFQTKSGGYESLLNPSILIALEEHVEAEKASIANEVETSSKRTDYISACIAKKKRMGIPLTRRDQLFYDSHKQSVEHFATTMSQSDMYRLENISLGKRMEIRKGDDGVIPNELMTAEPVATTPEVSNITAEKTATKENETLSNSLRDKLRKKLLLRMTENRKRVVEFHEKNVGEHEANVVKNPDGTINLEETTNMVFREALNMCIGSVGDHEVLYEIASALADAGVVSRGTVEHFATRNRESSTVLSDKVLNAIMQEAAQSILSEVDIANLREMTIADMKNLILKNMNSALETLDGRITENLASLMYINSNSTDTSVQAMSIYLMEALQGQFLTADVIGEVKGKLETMVQRQVLKLMGIKESVEIFNNPKPNEKLAGHWNEEGTSYNKGVLEDIVTTSMPVELRILFSSQFKYMRNGDGTHSGYKTDLGFQAFESFDNVVNAIQQALSTNGVVPNDVTKVVEMLRAQAEATPYLADIADALTNGTLDDSVINSFMYTFSRSNVQVRNVSFNTADGSVSVVNTAGRGARSFIVSNYLNGIQASGLLRAVDNGLGRFEMRYNMKRVQEVLGKLETARETFLTKENITSQDILNLASILNDIGINVDGYTLFKLITEGSGISDGERARYAAMTDYKKVETTFDFSENTSEPLGLIYNTLKRVTENSTYDGRTSFENIRGGLNRLAAVQSKVMETPSYSTYRDNGKTYSTFASSMSIFELFNRLSGGDAMSEKYINVLRNSSYSSNALWLRLQSDSQLSRFKERSGIEVLSNGRIRVDGNLGQKLSAIDELAMRLLLYVEDKADSGVGTVDVTIDNRSGDIKNNQVTMRLGRTVLSTMSDKGTSVVAHMPVVTNVMGESGHSPISTSVETYMLQQLVLPELRRILQYNEANMQGNAVNIAGFNSGSKMFCFMPILNTITVTANGQKQHFLNFLQTIHGSFDEFVRNYPDVYHQFEQEARSMLSNAIAEQVKERMKMLSESSLEIADGKITLNGKKYSMESLVTELCVNEMVNSSNAHMVLFGDVALYAKENRKLFPNGDPSKAMAAENGVEWSQYSNAIMENIVKRLAAFIAPGHRLPTGTGLHNEFNQVVIKDFNVLSSNLPYLANLYFGGDKTRYYMASEKRAMNAVEYVKISLDKYNASTMESERTGILNDLKEKFAPIAAYFNVNATDGQSYTTLREHLNVLYGQGRITRGQWESMTKKAIENTEFTAQELSVILQPLKPVYTGPIVDENLGMLRTMYVKCSSFPLVPQLTRGLEIDGLRLMMEESERIDNTPMHVAYESAVKVGAPTNPLRVFTPDGKFNTELTVDNFRKAAIPMDKSFYRIQQDNGGRENGRVTVRSQMKDLLFGDGMLDHGNFVLDGKSMTGRQLQSEYNTVLSEMMAMRRQNMLNELGLTNEMVESIDRGETTVVEHEAFAGKLADFIKRRMEARGMPHSEIEAIAVKSIDGRFSFTTPLDFIGSGGARLSDVINAMVASDVTKFTLPGNDVVLASNAGFVEKAHLGALTKEQASHIIFTDRYTGELRAEQYFDVVDGTTLGDRVGRYQKRAGNETLRAGAVARRWGQEYIILGRLEGNMVLTSSRDGGKYVIRKMPVTAFADAAIAQYPITTIGKGNYIITENNRIINIRTGKEAYTSEKAKSSKYVKARRENILRRALPREQRRAIPPHEGVSTMINGRFYKLQPSQVLIPSFFRDANGNKINLFENGKPNEKYVEWNAERGCYMLKSSMVDAGLLQFPSTRIPSGTHASMGMVEVVGFLPPECGDMMIVPDAISTKKGSDFDIDVEHMYHYNMVTDANGKIRKMNRADVDAGGDRMRYLENRFIDINRAVLSNPNRNVQSLIARPLSKSFGMEQAAIFSDMETRAKMGADYGTIFDGQRQADAFLRASIGKQSVGIYANGSRLNSLLQQMEAKPTIEVFGKPLKVRFGDCEMQPLGGIRNGSNTRHISESLDEALNLATDNAKDNALGRLGINSENINAHVTMLLMGFDMVAINGKNYSIPALVFNHPAIKRMVELRMQNGSLMAKNSKAARERLMYQLGREFGIDAEAMSQTINGTFLNVGKGNEVTLNVNPDAILNTIRNGKTPSAQEALEVLRFFTTMEMVSSTMQNINTVLGLQSNGASNQRGRLQTQIEIATLEDKAFTGLHTTDSGTPTMKINGLEQLIRTNDGKYTAFGEMLATSTRMASTLADAYFIDSKIIDTLEGVEGIANSIANPMMARNQEVVDNVKQTVLAIVRANAVRSLGINTREQRIRLLADISGDRINNESLASYVQRLRNNNTLSSNEFLKRLSSRVQKSSETNEFLSASYLNFMSDYGTRIDSEAVVDAVRDLYENAYALPDRNGQKYTSRDLVSDLVQYELLVNAPNSPNSFLKYIPTNLLNEIGLYQHMEQFGSERNMNNLLLNPGTWLQVFQHHPEMLRAESVKSLSRFNPENPNGFIAQSEIVFKTEQSMPDFLKVRVDGTDYILARSETASSENSNTYRLYNTKGDRVHTEAEAVLSPRFAKENPNYAFENNSPFKGKLSNINLEVQNPTANFSVNEMFGIKNGSLRGSLRNMTYDMFHGSSMFFNSYVQQHMPLLKLVTERGLIGSDTKIHVITEAEVQAGRFEALSDNAYGFYDSKTNTVFVYEKAAQQNPKELVTTIVHETIHAATVSYLNKFFTADNNLIMAESKLPKEVRNLYNAYLEAQYVVETSKDAPSMVKYSVDSIHEFVATMLTEKSVQEYFNGKKSNLLGKERTLWEQFKQFIVDIVSKLTGIDVNKDSILANSLEAILENKKSIEEHNKANDTETYKGSLLSDGAKAHEATKAFDLIRKTEEILKSEINEEVGSLDMDVLLAGVEGNIFMRRKENKSLNDLLTC